MTVEYCGDGFCVPEKPNIDVTCHDLGQKAGKWIMYQRDGKTCYCVCSCLGEGTKVTKGDGSEIKVEDMQQGVTKVLAAGKDLHFTSQVAQSVVHTSTGETKNTIHLQYEMNGKLVDRVVTMDHPFYLANKKLVGAGALQMDDKLMDKDGNPVTIKKITWGSYIGKFWEFAVSMEKPDSDYKNHLVLTEGVVTGDYAISVYENYPIDSSEVAAKGRPARPFVGSPEWKARNRRDPKKLDDVVQFEHGIFIPASHYEVEIPEHASAFLPNIQAALLEAFAPKEPLSNPNLFDMCEYLIEFVFEPHYPDIKFLFNWYDDQVNSFAWVDDITGDQIVYLSGGLARIVGFEIEGVTMALAHEVGHLLGRPKLENGLTCEGQADWFAGSVVMRTLWFGEEYFTKTNKAIRQLKVLYGYLLECEEHEDVEAPETDDFGQPYPSNACRIQTYKLAMTSPTPPACSLCDVDEEDEDGDDEDFYIADGSEQFDEDYDDEDYDDEEDEEFEEDDFDEEAFAKISGARDRQRKKKFRMEDEELLAKAPGARDRQRRKKRAMDEEFSDELLAKAPGARDRQRRKKRAMDEEFSDELLAKAPGARDRQRRKKRAMDEEFSDELLAKAPGARDRQRRKKRAMDEEFSDELLAKAPGARDRQRRKKRAMEEDADLLTAKVSGARDRQRRKKNRFDEVALDAIEELGRKGKGDGARDRQRKKKRHISGKVSGARDRQHKKKQ